jgi:uncharacterized membrane protein YtjA (UPF0391 family)
MHSRQRVLCARTPDILRVPSRADHCDRKPGTVLACLGCDGMLTWALTCLILILVEVVVSFSEARIRVRWVVQSLCVMFLILLLVHTLFR